jgi:hypothetical protein
MKSGRKFRFDSVFVLLVFGVFAAASLLLVMIGANVYRGAVKESGANNEMRSSLSYVLNKVRAYDEVGGVRLRNMDGLEVLCLTSGAEGEEGLVTYLYYYDGELREQYTFAEEPFVPGGGDVVLTPASFSMSQKGGLLTITAEDSRGRETSASVCLRAEETGGGAE